MSTCPLLIWTNKNQTNVANLIDFSSYRDVEETDPLGSDDEADKIYVQEPEQEPEELSEKIEKVMHHRIGPKWRK